MGECIFFQQKLIKCILNGELQTAFHLFTVMFTNSVYVNISVHENVWRNAI
jgi:hypothetical protein